MSSALGIASVTYVLKDLLNNGLIDHNVSEITGGNVIVSALPPDRIDLTSGGQSQLNLYMYRVSFNQGWNNVGFPSHDKQGSRVSNPPLSLNLHYLITSCGVNELHSEILLGYCMQLLHETPILDRKAIRRSLTNANPDSGSGLPDEFKALVNSGLAEQEEQIKIIPENLSTEEISKLWIAFGAKYRPTAAYQVSVVLIESKVSIKTPLKVKHPMIYVHPFKQPVIEKIKSQSNIISEIVEDQPILISHRLFICGRNLKSDNVKIRIGDTFTTPDIDNITDSQIVLSLPNNLMAGVQSIQIFHNKMKGSTLAVQYSVESNLAAFVLSPYIEPGSISYIKATDIDSEMINITVNPPVKDTQKVTLLLNEFNEELTSKPSNAYSFQALALTSEVPSRSITNLKIPIKGVKTGKYIVRIQIDGAESPLDIDDQGNYIPPVLII